MEKAFEIQRQVRDNAKTLQTYLTDLQNWEAEMKCKEAALNGEFEQDLPPVRSKVKKDKPVVKQKKVEKRIPSSDYKAWDSFDVDKACEEVDMEDVGPASLDSNKSKAAKMEKLRDEAQHEKERGNSFVKQEKWDEAIACYNRAIELIKDDAIYYANRGLCYLKKDSLHQAETDCTAALRLDPTYVKALQRRATARERLGSLRAASHDLAEVLRLEPHNAPAKRQLDAIKNRMGTKGSKSKSSPSSTPTSEGKPFGSAKIVELRAEPETKPPTELDAWRDGADEGIKVIKPVKKPPHLRSKRALKSIPIQEIPLGKTEPEKPPTRLKIIEIEDNLSHGDSNNNESDKTSRTVIDSTGDKREVNSKPELNKDAKEVKSPESEKLVKDVTVKERVDVKSLVPPVNSVQFMAGWKMLKDDECARSHYLSIIDPSKIPSIFANSLESDVLSDVLRLLHADAKKFGSVAAYLRGLTKVKRFSALAMFLSNNDKELLKDLLQHCKTAENCSENDIADLKNKFEL